MSFPRGPIWPLLAVACAHPPRSTTTPEPIPWVPFYWVRASTDSARFDRAAMLFQMPILPGRPPSIVQLDLGGSGGMPDGYPPPGRALGSLPPIPRGQLYGVAGSTRLELLDLPADSAWREWQRGDVGTVGIPNYLSHALLIDLSGRRLAALPRPPELEQVLGPEAVVLPLEPGRFDRAVIPLTGGLGETYRALIDTGLSPFPLWTTKEIWTRLTGLEGTEAEVRIHRVMNRRGEMEFVAAKPTKSLTIGTWTLEPAEVVYLRRGPAGADLEGWRNGVDIVIGVAAWPEHTMILLDLAGHRLGLSARLPR